MAIKLSRIGHAALRVRDTDIAKKFYTEVLWFDIVEEDPEHAGCFMRLSSDENTDGQESLDCCSAKWDSWAGFARSGNL